MAAVKNRGTRVRVFVNLAGGIRYGFSVNEKTLTAYGDRCGLNKIDNSTPNPDQIIFGANSPKPNRVVFTDATSKRKISTFVAPDKEDDVVKGGGKVVKSSVKRGLTASKLVKTVYVPLNGYKYAWNHSEADKKYRTELGIIEATGAETDLVFGSFPKPPVASKLVNGKRVSTFCDGSKASEIQQKGWSITGL